MASLVLIGYWRSSRGPEWPDPVEFVDEDWNVDERSLVAAYLGSGTVPWASAGMSPCRICGRPNGSVEYTDGMYVWPDGLAHYVRDHSVRLPGTVVEHVLDRLSYLENCDVDRDWWKAVSRP